MLCAQGSCLSWSCFRALVCLESHAWIKVLATLCALTIAVVLMLRSLVHRFPGDHSMLCSVSRCAHKGGSQYLQLEWICYWDAWIQESSL